MYHSDMKVNDKIYSVSSICIKEQQTYLYAYMYVVNITTQLVEISIN